MSKAGGDNTLRICKNLPDSDTVKGEIFFIIINSGDMISRKQKKSIILKTAVLV